MSITTPKQDLFLDIEQELILLINRCRAAASRGSGPLESRNMSLVVTELENAESRLFRVWNELQLKDDK